MSGRISRSKAAALRYPSPQTDQLSDADSEATPAPRESQDDDHEHLAATDDPEVGDDINSPLALDSDEQPALATPSQWRGAGRRRRGGRVRGPARRKEVTEQESRDASSDTPRRRGGWRGRGLGGGRWAKAKGGPSHVTQVPIDKEGNMANIVNDEVELPEDPEGERKVSKFGELYGGREYRVRTFKIEGKGDRLYMLSTEPARCIGFRDSYLFFQKHRQLYKIIIAEDAKKDLIDRDIIPHSYKGRAIGVVTARSVFREFGARIIVGGKRILDDYLVDEARARGDIEGEFAVPDDDLPGGAEHYDRNRYVAWHGASSVYHTGNPSVPFLSGRPVENKKKKVVVNGANWMLEHALQASRFNSEIGSHRRQTLEGAYNVHTNSIQYPQTMQPTRVRWERVDEEARRSHDDSVNDKGLLTGWTRSSSMPARYTQKMMVVDTHLETPATVDLNMSSTALMEVGDDAVEEIPEEYRQKALEARVQQQKWRERWAKDPQSAVRINVSYNS